MILTNTAEVPRDQWGRIVGTGRAYTEPVTVAQPMDDETIDALLDRSA